MADFALNTTTAGQKSAAVAAGAGAADIAVSAKPGRISRIVIIAAGSAAITLYDHPTASSGAKKVWASPATTVAGDQYIVDIPVDNGIVAVQANGSPLVNIVYAEDGALTAVPGSGFMQNDGGQYTSYHAAGAPGAGASYTGPGRLCRIVVLAQGSVVTSIYDAASATGQVIWRIPASGTTAVAQGTVFNVQCPVTTGIYVGGATNTSECVVLYAKNGAFGR